MATEAEGFICPYCLVGFGTSGKLQGHFVEMHSGQGALDELDYINGEEEVSRMILFKITKRPHRFSIYKVRQVICIRLLQKNSVKAICCLRYVS